MSKRLIYEEDAIDAVRVFYADECALVDSIEEQLEKLPSAQPQLEECPIYGGMCGYPSNLCYECPRHGGAHEKPLWWTAGLQPFAQPQRWIPVTERLPDEWKRVLIQNDEGLFLVGFVKDRGWGKEWFYQYEMYDYDEYIESEQGKIVAWCELPEPWKGE